MNNDSQPKEKTKKVRIVFGIIIAVIGLSLWLSGTEDILDSENQVSEQVSSVTQSKVTKENYNKIKNGMTKSEVKKILGEPSSISESETPGIGTMELNHYQEAFSFKGIDIYYVDGKVYMKNWTEL